MLCEAGLQGPDTKNPGIVGPADEDLGLLDVAFSVNSTKQTYDAQRRRVLRALRSICNEAPIGGLAE